MMKIKYILKEKKVVVNSVVNIEYMKIIMKRHKINNISISDTLISNIFSSYPHKLI